MLRTWPDKYPIIALWRLDLWTSHSAFKWPGKRKRILADNIPPSWSLICQSQPRRQGFSIYANRFNRFPRQKPFTGTDHLSAVRPTYDNDLYWPFISTTILFMSSLHCFIPCYFSHSFSEFIHLQTSSIKNTPNVLPIIAVQWIFIYT